MNYLSNQFLFLKFSSLTNFNIKTASSWISERFPVTSTLGWTRTAWWWMLHNMTIIPLDSFINFSLFISMFSNKQFHQVVWYFTRLPSSSKTLEFKECLLPKQGSITILSLHEPRSILYKPCSQLFLWFWRLIISMSKDTLPCIILKFPKGNFPGSHQYCDPRAQFVYQSVKDVPIAKGSWKLNI